jgi:hypothetical protein
VWGENIVWGENLLWGENILWGENTLDIGEAVGSTLGSLFPPSAADDAEIYQDAAAEYESTASVDGN